MEYIRYCDNVYLIFIYIFFLNSGHVMISLDIFNFQPIGLGDMQGTDSYQGEWILCMDVTPCYYENSSADLITLQVCY